MRKIKFRGKRVDSEKWAYGYYFVEVENNEDKIGFEHLSFIKEKYGDHYHNYEVDPKTVGQYTGLKDKNGKEIYKGDIVKTIDLDDYEKPFDIVEEVIIDNGLLIPFYDFDTREEYFYDLFEWEIIGNSYENPNLLK